jgi:hypothetical protein
MKVGDSSWRGSVESIGHTLVVVTNIDACRCYIMVLMMFSTYCY